MDTFSINSHIEMTPGMCGGKPHIAGHRITVQNIVIWHERLGMSADEIANEYDLTLSDIYAALTYYHDHKKEIDDRMRSDEEFVETMRTTTPSLVEQKLRERLDAVLH